MDCDGNKQIHLQQNQTQSLRVKIVTFNCKSAKRSTQCIRELCDKYDIIALQEHWLMPFDIPFLGTIHPDFEYTGKSAVDTASGILQGRPYGGVGILWRKSLFPSVSIIPCNSVRITAIKAAVSGSSIVIASVYMPTDTRENFLDFTECMGELSALVENCNSEAVFLVGDFNAHPNTHFYDEMMGFCSEQDWLCADVQYLGVNSNTYTYISDAHGCTRWLDHCLVTKAAWSSIVSVSVQYNVYWSDHHPLVLECNLDVFRPKTVLNKQSKINKVWWGDRNPEQISMYNKLCCEKLGCIELPLALESCYNTYCTDLNHKQILEQLYSEIIVPGR